MEMWGIVILCGSVKGQGSPGTPTPPITPVTPATRVPLPDRCAFALPQNKDEFVSACPFAQCYLHVCLVHVHVHVHCALIFSHI